MGDVLVNVEKTYGGETWVNTHCLRLNGTGGSVSDADMASLGVGTPITATNTASGGAVNPITRILSFERQVHRTPITISRVYVTDGKRNDLQNPDYFWSASLALLGLVPMGTFTEVQLAPGTIALVLNRVPVGYNSRQGRMFIRGYLVEGGIRFNMRGGVDWESPAVQAGEQPNIVSAVNNSGIATMFSGAVNAGVAMYCIPHYLPKALASTPHEVGQLMNATPVSAINMGNPRSRQMLKGKKRKKAATGTVAV